MRELASDLKKRGMCLQQALLESKGDQGDRPFPGQLQRHRERAKRLA